MSGSDQGGREDPRCRGVAGDGGGDAGRHIRNFSPDTVETFKQAMAAAGNGGATISNRLSALSSLGKFGTQTKAPKGKGYVLDENPVTRVKRPRRQEQREKFLAVDELQRLLSLDLPIRERLVIDLLIDTALRASELAHAKVGDLALEGDAVALHVRVKGGRLRGIPLGPEVADVLQRVLREREARPEEPLLLNARGERYDRRAISQLIFRAAERAGIERLPVRAHVLRHSAATLAIEAGADVPSVASLLNHSNLATAQRYIHNRASRVDSVRAAEADQPDLGIISGYTIMRPLAGGGA